MKSKPIDRRAFLASVGGLALSPAAVAASAALDAKAARTAPGTIRLDWTSARAVAVLVSDNPDAAKRAMRPLASASGASVDLAAPVSPRPYFLACCRWKADGTSAISAAIAPPTVAR